MKKFIILCVLCVLFLSLSVSTADDSASAQPSNELTYNLQGYYAEIIYRCYFLSNSGVRLEYCLLYDSDFYALNKSLLSGALKTVSNFLSDNDWEVDCNTNLGSVTSVLSFDSIADYYLFQGYNGFSREENLQEENHMTFFRTETTIKRQTPFVGLDDIQKMVGRIYVTGCQKVGIRREKLVLKYTYGTPYSTKILTSDAMEINYSTEYGIYLHNFFIPSDKTDIYITMEEHKPNANGWYTVAVGASVLVALLPLGIYLYRKKRTKNHG